MSYADKLFIEMCTDIIENGYSTEGEKVRPKWADGTCLYPQEIWRSQSLRSVQTISGNYPEKNVYSFSH